VNYWRCGFNYEEKQRKVRSKKRKKKENEKQLRRSAQYNRFSMKCDEEHRDVWLPFTKFQLT
jgi:hypothetical protein